MTVYPNACFAGWWMIRTFGNPARQGFPRFRKAEFSGLLEFRNPDILGIARYPEHGLAAFPRSGIS
jgi:hypothetical protein